MLFKKLFIRAVILSTTLWSSVVLANNLPGILDDFASLNFFPGEVSSWKVSEIKDTDGKVFVKWEGAKGQEIEVTVRPASHRTIDTIYAALGAEINKAVGQAGGNTLVNEQYFGAAVSNSGMGFLRLHIVAGTQGAVYWWKYRAATTNQLDLQSFSEKLTLLIRRIQYEGAKLKGNVIMGAWSEPVQAYASLLAKNNSSQAEKVYRELLEVDSGNIDVHAKFMSVATNKVQLKESARIVNKYAESAELIEKSAGILSQAVTPTTSFKPLEKTSKKLRVVLLPLPPYNPWLLTEVADTYERITGIPVEVREFPGDWVLPASSRTRYRSALERFASQILPDISDFSDWSLVKIHNQLLEKAKQEGPSAVSNVNALFEKFNSEGGQWNGDELLNSIAKKVKPYAANSPYTMYVGFTETDIYSGDANFAFSLYGGYPKALVSILSYARMTSSFTQEQSSRKRLVERISKELVPASLQRLAIPRSVDPSCPYSYANGLQRVDEKTLTLSKSLISKLEAIKKLTEK